MPTQARRNLTPELRAAAVTACRDELGIELKRLPGRRQLYLGSDGKRYQLNTTDWLAFMTDAAGNHWQDPMPKLEGKDGAEFLLVSTTDRRKPNRACVYRVPVKVAVRELRKAHKNFASDSPDGRKGDSRRALHFKPAGDRVESRNKASFGYETKWKKYLVGEPSLAAPAPETVEGILDDTRKRLVHVLGVEAIEVTFTVRH